MLFVPSLMAGINRFIFTDIPSPRDLYEKMGFRYVNGRGHTDVVSAESSTPCLVNVNASIDVVKNANPMIQEAIKQLNTNNDETR